MISFFEQGRLQNVVGIGHSLGAVATMYAALSRPELFGSLVLIEPIFLPPQVLQMVAANPDILNDIPVIRNTARRRTHWPTRDAAFEHFRSKAVFKRWPDSSLWDYVNHALRRDNAGEITLTYSRDWEAHIYALPPMDVWGEIPAIPHDTLAIRGADSDSLFTDAWLLWQELQPQATFVEIAEAGHMVLMERAQLLGEIIRDFLLGKERS
jgi:pimeloyl-ACP methyl ester carboxylesterase